MDSPTLALAEFAAGIKNEDIPRQVREKMRVLCLDAIGCAIGATRKDEIAKFAAALKKMDDGNSGSVWGLGFRASLPGVALINGTLVHFLEMDDVHKASLMHPAASIVPSALAACEVIETNGPDFITSLVVGYEIALRVGMAVGPVSHRKRGWHATGSCGIFGAAAAAGKILNLDTREMAWALGLAGIQPTGTWAFAEQGSMNKPLHAGRAAQGGVIASFLAHEGFSGPSNILEARDGGFLRAVSDDFDVSRLTDQLGHKYEVLECFPKLFPCCTYQHAPLSATFKILENCEIQPGEISRIIVKTSETARNSVGNVHKPRSVVEAQFSLPFGIAVSIFDKEATLAQFSSERLKDSRVMELAEKVDVITDAEIDRQFPEKFPSEVEIQLRNGKRYVQRVAGPPGELENPVADTVIEKKFRRLSDSVLSSERSDTIVDFFRKLESQDQVVDLLHLIDVAE